MGPLADQTAVLLGNYNGSPTHTVSVLEAMKAEFPEAKITYAPGTQFLSNQGNPVPGSMLTTAEGKPGLLAEYGSGPSIDSLLGVRADGFARISLGGRPVTQMYGPGENMGRVHLEQGHPLTLQVEYGHTPGSRIEAQLIWAHATDVPDPAAVAAAKQAGVVIAVVGITSRLEGEEMPVNQPGFLGGDRTNLDLPGACR